MIKDYRLASLLTIKNINEECKISRRNQVCVQRKKDIKNRSGNLFKEMRKCLGYWFNTTLYNCLISSPVRYQILYSSPVRYRKLFSSPVRYRRLFSSPVRYRKLFSSPVRYRKLFSSPVRYRKLFSIPVTTL